MRYRVCDFLIVFVFNFKVCGRFWRFCFDYNIFEFFIRCGYLNVGIYNW